MKLNKTQARRRGGAQTEDAGRYPAGAGLSVEGTSASLLRTKAQPKRVDLMEAVLERGNLMKAYERVLRNKGASGVDGIGVSEFKEHLKRHWPTIRARLLAGEYIPAPVRRVDIPKPQGGVRTLGIPTLTDRMIQQALHQVLSPLFEPGFSDSSYGFRPGRSAHQAVEAAGEHVAAGNRWVVDLDLEKFFDRVNHDIVMGKLAQEVGDARVLKLIRRYLEAGMMADGLISPRREGMPQGGPLSPLLSNILLTELDRELECRGHRFCRYADDFNVYVKSEKAGHRLMAKLEAFLWIRLKLKVNSTKSAVARPWEWQFLGYRVMGFKESRLSIAKGSRQRFADKVRAGLRKARGRNLARAIEALNPLLRGWAAYFRLVKTKRPFLALDGWIRHKLRAILWRQWKRVYTRARHLMKAGLSEVRAWKSATNGRGPWWNSGASHMNAAFPKVYFDRLGLVSLLDTACRLRSLP